MNNQNITKVYLLRVPLENDYKNTLYFANAQAQQTYFQSKIVKSYTDFSYQRKDDIIRIPDIYDNVYNCNYVMYQNSAYNNKWFYAFIDDMTYISDGRTDIHIETDVIQTWLFDYTVKSSFIEREHVSDDTIGLHTVPENLELGEVIQVENPTELFMYGSSCYICIACTEVASNIPDVDDARNYNGIYSGLYYMLFNDSEDASNFLHGIDSLGKADSIDSIFLIPTRFQFSSTWYQASIGEYSFDFAMLEESTAETVLADNQACTRPNKIGNNYSPRNNKLFTYPYNYFYVSNHVGSDITFRYEDFANSSPLFRIIGAITPGCSIKCVPLNYKNTTDTVNSMYSYNYGIVGGKYPICSWNSDVYTNWLTQNGVNIGLDLVSSGASLITGGVAAYMSGGLLGGGEMMSGAMGIANTLVQVYQHSLIPDQARGNTNSGDVTFSSKMLEFTAYKMSIRNEYCEIIDSYFDMFGYKVNTVKVPNKAHRSNYWYTKCIDVSIDGNIPQNDMRKIKDCYNNGIRFWRNASNIEDYSVSNSIV